MSLGLSHATQLSVEPSFSFIELVCSMILFISSNYTVISSTAGITIILQMYCHILPNPMNSVCPSSTIVDQSELNDYHDVVGLNNVPSASPHPTLQYPADWLGKVYRHAQSKWYCFLIGLASKCSKFLHLYISSESSELITSYATAV